MDKYLYDETIDVSEDVDPMVDKEMLYVNDQNGGSYNGQITFDTSVLSNSGRWLAYSEGYLEIPFVISALSDTKVTDTFNSWMAGLKNGSHHIIDSMQVDFGNTNVVQLSPYLNFFVSYKLMSSFSTSDVQKWGDMIGFQPDTATSFSYSAAASADGIGYCNNKVASFVPTGGAYYRGYSGQRNDGHFKRLQQTAFTPTATQNAGGAAIPTMNTVAKASAAAKAYFTDDGGADDGRKYYWVINATIRLKDLADFFDKMPLVKGSFLRIIVNYNACNFNITSANAAAAAHTLTTSLPTMTAGRTNPVLISSSYLIPAAAADSVPSQSNPYDIDASETAFQCNILATAQVTAPSRAISNTRLYVPGYQLNPLYEKQLLDLRPTRKVIYTDVYNYVATNVTSGSQINAIITNGIANPKYIVVIPQVNAAANGLANLAPHQSPFDTSPATTLPLAQIQNFNIQVGGTNIFQQNFLYDFEAFKNELASINAINGGESTGLTSGLLSYKDFEYGYRYYVADLSRRKPSEDRVPKSIVLIGTNSTGVAIDLYCYVVYERSIEIDMVAGGLVTGSN